MSRALCITQALLLFPKKGKAKRYPTMNRSTPFGLSLTLLVASLASCATGDFSRVRHVTLPPVYEQNEVTYEQQWLAGKAVTILRIDTLNRKLLENQWEKV